MIIVIIKDNLRNIVQKFQDGRINYILSYDVQNLSDLTTHLDDNFVAFQIVVMLDRNNFKEYIFESVHPTDSNVEIDLIK